MHSSIVLNNCSVYAGYLFNSTGVSSGTMQGV
nr:MAG TPA: hypothetical protein [Caudoviricetes sp.]